jgi:outer membrane lipoprotein LolB
MITKCVGMYPSCNFQLLLSDKGRLYFFLYPLVFCICFLLGGCASFVFKPSVVETRIVEAGGAAPSVNFEFMGRVLVKGGDKGFSGGVRWSHTSTVDNIHLLSPFGQVVAEIKSSESDTLLTTSEQRIYRATNVENLTKQVLGWRLPILGLQYWVRGLNSPKTKSEIDRDGDGRIIGIRQDGWTITYTSYFPSKLIKIERPRVLVLKRSNLKIKLVIDNWEAK